MPATIGSVCSKIKDNQIQNADIEYFVFQQKPGQLWI
jgi:hypothetical protein